MKASVPSVDVHALQARLDQQQQELAAMRASSSWRMTAPLRWVGLQLKKVFLKSEQPFRDEPEGQDYAQWVRVFGTVSAELVDNFKRQIDGFVQLPLVSILLPVEMHTLSNLSNAVASVQHQIYPNWELCLALPTRTPDHVRIQVASWSEGDSRVKHVYTALVGGSLCNAALQLADAKSAWLLKINAIDMVALEALFVAIKAINQHENCELLYADEDMLDAAGQRSQPVFKCMWNRELHLSRNLTGRFAVYRTSRVRALGGYHAYSHTEVDFDLSLRYLEQIGSEQVVHVPHVLFHAGEAQGLTSTEGLVALNAHFARCGIAAKAEKLGYGYRIHYALPAMQPQVSLIIPTRNGLHLLRQCIESIQAKTAYSNYDIIVVDNGSDDAATLDYLRQLASLPCLQVMRVDAPFNYSALNNVAVAVAKGELIALLNNDVEVISPDWLSEMVSRAVQPKAGVVGACLWYPNDTLQHGGVVLGLGGVAGHAFAGLPRGCLGYQARAGLAQQYSAVTAACWVVKKSVYNAVGGLNDKDLAVAYNDIDFCLRVQEAGYQNVWTPFAELYHHESATRGYEDNAQKQQRHVKEKAYMYKRWGQVLDADPAYSPNLTLDANDFSYAWPPRVNSGLVTVHQHAGQAPFYERLQRLAQGRLRVAYVAENIHSSTFRYRALNMAEVLNASLSADEQQIAAVQTSAACFFLSDLQHAEHLVNELDVLVVSRMRDEPALAALIKASQAEGKRVLFDIDDWVFDTEAIDLIIKNMGQSPSDEVLNYWYSVVARIGQTLRFCDGAITSSNRLADKIKAFHDVPVAVVPNFANQAQLGISEPLYQAKVHAGDDANGDGKERKRKRVRLGYFSGSASHDADLGLLAYALERVMAADDRVDLVLVGHVDVVRAFGPRFGGYLKGHLSDRVEQHAFVDYVTLQKLIAEVDFNLVPLQSNDFTDCKSELKYVDAALVGTCTVASPVHAYAQAIKHGENGYLAADDQWEQVLMTAIADLDEQNCSPYSSHQQLVVAAYEDVQRRWTWKTQRTTILHALAKVEP
jgi:GT2 family glycosyltransferase/glycosyltransferase involved in cell wall biosynthesis